MATHLTFDLQLDEGTDIAMLHTSLASATRALVLLLDNAQKFTRPAEAALPMQAKGRLERVTLRVAFAQPSQVAFIVEDTGIGVPPSEAEHIFDEFVQLDEYYDGTGIGLTVARSLARRMGGDIVLDTAYEGGARFVMTLPIA
jgi:signal transduction histidine kinase